MGLGAETYTFLFTDIVDSTRLMQDDEAAMVAAVDLHDALLPPLFAAHGGHVFKNVGDAYCVAFPAALPALQAAVAAQRALADQPWNLPQPLRVRMALHTGTARLRENDYRGVTLSQVARLLGSAAGGQILIAGATAAELGALPDGVSLLNLGSVRLRGLERPERVYQAAAPGLDHDFPPLRSLENHPNNLRDQLSSFVGREPELAVVMDLCLRRRLVTLTGTGGCGKTRLALQVATELLDDFEDGICMTELAGITDAGAVPFAIASDLKVRQDGGQSVEDALIAYLKPRRLLLILDNCEHLIDASARIAQNLLQGAPGLKILATSRERLNVAGETVWRVPPLSGPSGRTEVSVDAILESDAGSLFVERATAAQPQFRLSAGNARAVAQVCRRLEGLPLSLELAASRVGVLPVEQLAARLDARLRQLGTGPRDGAERHRSLQATLDWSYELLKEPERLLLCRLSVFSGGWTLEAAEAVCSGDGIDGDDVLDLLSRLIDKSLVVPEEHEGTARYHLQETLRAYTLEKQSPGTAGALRSRHASYFLEWAEAAEPHLSGPEQADWLNKIEDDHDNLRAALNHWDKTDPEALQRFATALYHFWYTRGHLTEGRTWLETAVANAPEARTIGRVKAINRAGVFAWAQGDSERASHLYTRGLEICRALGDSSREAAVLINLSLVASNRGRFDEAHRLQQDALQIYRRLNDRQNIAITLHNLGATAAEGGDEQEACRYYSESLSMFRAASNDDQAAMALRCLGAAAYRTGDLATASDYLRESLGMCRHLGDRQGIAFIFAYLGYLAAAKRLDALAVRLLGAARALRRSIDWGETVFDERIMGAHESRLRARVPADEFTRLWEEGADLTVEQVLDTDELWT